MGRFSRKLRSREVGPFWRGLQTLLLYPDALGVAANVLGRIVSFLLAWGVIDQAQAAQLAQVPVAWQWGIALTVAAVGFPAVYRGCQWLKYLFQPVQIYKGYDEKESVRGDLREELLDARQAWLAFESGHYFGGMNLDDVTSVERLLMLDPSPEADFLAIHMEQAQRYTEDIRRVRGDILKATRLAREHDIDVRWYDGPIMNVAIFEPRSRCSSVRVHYQLPGVKPADWVDFFVRWESKEDAVAVLETGYDKMWGGDRCRCPPEDLDSVLGG